MDEIIQNNKPVYQIKNKDLYSLIFLSVFTYLFIRLGVLNGFNLGLSITSVCLSLTLMLYVLSKDCKNKIITVLTFLLSMVLAVSFSFHDNSGIKFLTAIILWFITVFSLNTANGTSLCNDGTYFKVFDVLYVGVIEPFRNLPKIFSAIKCSFKGKNNKFGMVVLGVLVALPVMFVVIPLLSSADAAFESIVKKVFSNVVLLVISFILTCFVLPFIASYSFSLSKGIVKEKNKALNAKKGKASPVFLNTFLCIVGFVYLVFLFSQLAYISDTFSFLLPKEFSMAEFARSGFFQMAAIAVINLIITFVVSVIEKAKDNGRLPVSTKILLTFFSLFSIFLIVNAFIRMSMYIDMYGLTQKRVITSVFMIMLCVIFIVVLIRIFNEKFKYINFIFIICALTLVFLSVSDIDSNISKYNYNKYVAGEIDVDFEHYISLGYAAVPELEKLTKDDGLLTSSLAYHALESIDYDENEGSFFAQNLVKSKAEKTLEKYADENFEYIYFDEDLYEYNSKVIEYNATDFMPDLEKVYTDSYMADFEIDAMFYEEDPQKTLELTLSCGEEIDKTLAELKSKYTLTEVFSDENVIYYIVSSSDINSPEEFAAIAVSEENKTISYMWMYEKGCLKREIDDYKMFIEQNFLVTIV
ncbi:MAG: DUF4173 domain-containing protein [Clostridia bacterium]|nr:DUF4173 domain-containing protein [Clostridia bacterium]